jgi:hypothetical protein
MDDHEDNYERYAEEFGEEAALIEWGDDFISELQLEEEKFIEEMSELASEGFTEPRIDDPDFVGYATELPRAVEHTTGVASYDLVLDAIALLEDFDARQVRHLLPRIRAAKDDLFPRYKTGGRRVAIDYGDRLRRYAYLLTYYPTYFEQAYASLGIAEQLLLDHAYPSLAHEKMLKASIFGAGPAPELPALLRFLDERDRRILIARLLDRQPRAWSDVRDATVGRARWNQDVSIYSDTFVCDLSSADPFSAHTDQIASSRLIWFQNCLNEVTFQAAAARTLVDAMAEGAVLLIGQVGRPDHPAANVTTLTEAAGTRLQVLRPFMHAISVGSAVPRDVQDALALPPRRADCGLLVAVKSR